MRVYDLIEKYLKIQPEAETIELDEATHAMLCDEMATMAGRPERVVALFGRRIVIAKPEDKECTTK